jgi:ribonuclease HII
MPKIIAGVDEAGRGAVIGPLVIAGVSMEEKDLEKLKKWNVRDSKLIAPRVRVKLADMIEGAAKSVIIIKVEACKIDNYRKQGVNLNRLEAMKFGDVISFMEPDTVYVDAPENPEKLTMFLKKMTKMGSGIIAEHKADMKYPIVGAASIVAKVARDNAMEELRKKYGDMGPGYSSNAVTMKWMNDWLEKHGKFPDCVRRTWATTERVEADKKQSRLLKWARKKD